MTMPRGVSRALYSGNGQAVDFPFLFKVFEEDQLSVHVTSPEGVTTEATGWSAQLDDGGGTLTYLHNGAPLPEGWKLAIVRDMPFVQEVDLITGTRFDPEVIETALDVATAERQQLLERLARAVVVEPTDEAGPEALLADIRDARTSAASSATSAAANANAAAESARAAAGSAAIATEEREAACICAGEAKDARDVAIAQAEAANTLMEAELAKVNAIVAANRTDQQAAVTAARQWAEKEADVPVEYDEDGNPRYSARHWAENAQKIAIEPPTAERRGAVRVGAGLHLETAENGEKDVLAVSPDGVTTKVDADGLLTALGGNLLLNSEEWITASCTWVASVTGWHEVLVINGGNGGRAFWRDYNCFAQGGNSGAYEQHMVYLHAGEEVPVVIGSGGLGNPEEYINYAYGSPSTFGDVTANGEKVFRGEYSVRFTKNSYVMFINSSGSGLGGGLATYDSSKVTTQAGWHHYANCDGRWYGAGGGAYSHSTVGYSCSGNGAQGAVRVRWHDPAKANGPLPAPALLMARRMAVRAAEAPATVNLYDPETGQGSVWREEDAEARLAEGLITGEAWQEICAAKAAEERAEWLASPDTVAERFELLRGARDAKLAATDYLVAPDYPLTDEERAAVTAWRQALRDLPAQAGAPWDGGGALTPWPAEPACCEKAPAEGENPCA